RVSQYFHKSGDTRPFVGLLHGVLDRIETVITGNEKEALILENELIKKHRPPYNIFLRDDKNYLYLRIDPREDFPRLDLVRRRRKDGAIYFGPHHSASSVRGTHALVNRYFGLRTCRDHQFRNRSRPCLEHQMGRCLGPCSGLATPAEYGMRVKDALLFLKGRRDRVLKSLMRRMKDAADAENFEEAARLRDQLRAVKSSLTRQAVVLPTSRDVDAVGLARDGESAAFAVLRFEGGVMLDRIPYVLENAVAPDEDLIGTFLIQYYARAPIPDQLLVPKGILKGSRAIREVLSQRGGRSVRILEPSKGPRGDAIRMAGRNAEALLKESLLSGRVTARAMARVAELLGLESPPSRIEAFDMSTISSTNPVGSMVVFTDGKPDKKAYRTFAVRGEEGEGDTGFMKEVLTRRFRRAREDGVV
ncbi:MAG: excinuclease ABC subunit UvrC, partial [Deltaproteobacteria bacterium]|nr:excinuclease ABC subunit UvrC [Deltaproteobacteria bacterium]